MDIIVNYVLRLMILFFLGKNQRKQRSARHARRPMTSFYFSESRLNPYRDLIVYCFKTRRMTFVLQTIRVLAHKSIFFFLTTRGCLFVF